MEFKKLNIDLLVPADYNPRKKLKPGDAEFEKIKNSINEFGYVDPVIVNKDLTVIGGHQRISVLKTLGYEEIDCVVVEVDKTKEKALNIALNKITGEWNKELLADLIKDLQDLDYDTSFTGFEPPEIDALFNDLHPKGVKEDNFDEAPPENPITQSGDIWLLGRHRLICGDSTKLETYERLMDGKKANLTVTDPPYNVAYEGTAGHKFYADRKQRTTWNFDRPTKSKYHPTMKPIALVAYPITNSSLTNSIVLDPFGGSGSTLIACEQTDRICYTIELDEKYADVIVNRYIEQVGNDEAVYLLRNGEKIKYKDVVKTVEEAL